MKNRNKKEIRKWMIDQELTVQDIADESGVDQSLTSRTIDGIRNSRKVLITLVAMGCAEVFLDLPSDIKVDEIPKILRKAA